MTHCLSSLVVEDGTSAGTASFIPPYNGLAYSSGIEWKKYWATQIMGNLLNKTALEPVMPS